MLCRTSELIPPMLFLRLAASVLFILSLLKHSQKYLTTLEEIQRALYDAVGRGHLPPETTQRMEGEFHTFTNLVHLWRLCQIVFLEFTEGVLFCFHFSPYRCLCRLCRGRFQQAIFGAICHSSNSLPKFPEQSSSSDDARCGHYRRK